MSASVDDAVSSIAARREELFAELAARPQGLAWCRRHTALADDLVRMLHRRVSETYPGVSLTVLATGGYGRAELSPHSDIDVTVLPAHEAAPDLDAAVRKFFRDLHWAFGTALRMNVGYAFRLISDAPGLDATTRTGLMDARLLSGPGEVAKALQAELDGSFEAGQFVLAKIAEREAAFRKYHDTPLVVEPHLKEGAGGMRSFHAANWLREAIGDRPARASAAYDAVVEIRNLLHLQAEKAQDALTRPRQEEIAERLGRDPRDMMSQLVANLCELHREYESTRQTLHEARYQLSRGVSAVRGEARVSGGTDAGHAAVGVSVATQLNLRVEELPVGAPRSLNGPSALYAVSTGEATVRNLDRSGLLEYLLPELTACRTLIPNDSVHTYTVYEHTMRVLRNLDQPMDEPFLETVRSSVTDLEPLYLAALLHDVGKTDGTRDHSSAGADMAAEVCRRWGLAAWVSDVVVWLVREHLTMARFIRMRDIASPQTVSDFAEIVGNRQRLDLLTLLTFADIRAVSDTAWTLSQSAFLRELYERTASALETEAPAVDSANYRRRLLRQLRDAEESESRVEEFVDSLPAYYLTSTPPDVVRLHMHFVRKAEAGEPSVEVFHRPDVSATDLTICAPDQPGLLSKILGILYAYDLSVGGIRACTTATTPSVALDAFTINFGGRPVPDATLRQVTGAVFDVIEGRRAVEEVLRGRGKDPERTQEESAYVYHEGNPGILEVRAPRGRGMPYRISRWISEQGWNIHAARVGQWAGSAAAAFYVSRPDGEPLRADEVEAKLGSLERVRGRS
jgi:[protein-PII] uridylyltransferase